MEEQSSECMIERDKTGDVTTVREGCGGERTMSMPSRANRVVCSSLGSLSKLSTLNTTVSLEQDIQDGEQFVSWIKPPQKTTTVCAAPGGHFGIYEPLPQAILKPEIHVDICGPTKAGSRVDVPGPSYHQRPRMVWGAT